MSFWGKNFQAKKQQVKKPEHSVCLGRSRRPIWQTHSFYLKKRKLRPREVTSADPSVSVNCSCYNKMNKYSNARKVHVLFLSIRHIPFQSSRELSSRQWFRNPGSLHAVSLPPATPQLPGSLQVSISCVHRKRLWRITYRKFITIEVSTINSISAIV